MVFAGARRRPKLEGPTWSCSWTLTMIGVLDRVWQERVLVEQDGQVVPVRVCVELIRDVRDMIGCLLQKNNIKGPAHSCNQLCGLATGGASIPLKE